MKIIAASVALAVMATPAIARCTKGQNVSWYGEPQSLASGGRFDPNAETCAHRTHPFGTILRVVDLATGLGVECAVNDRGPNKWTGCEVDLSRRAAERVGMKGRGIIRAKIEVVRAVWPDRREALQDALEKEKGPDVAAGAF